MAKGKKVATIGYDNREINYDDNQAKKTKVAKIGLDGSIEKIVPKKDKGNFFQRSWNTVQDAGLNLMESFLNTTEGWADWISYKGADVLDYFGIISDEYADEWRDAIKRDLISETFETDKKKEIEQKSYLNKTTRSVVQGTGNVLANIGGGHALGINYGADATKIDVAKSALLSYTSASGNATSEALRNGADYNTAKKVGVINGIAEAISEQFFDAMPGTKAEGWGGKLTGKVGSLVEKYFGTNTGKLVMKTLNASGEGFEEIISNMLVATGNDVAHWLDKNYTYGMDNQTGNVLKDIGRAWTSQESWEAFLSASLTSALTNGASNFISNTQKNNIIRSYAKENNMKVSDVKKMFSQSFQQKAQNEITTKGETNLKNKTDIETAAKIQTLKEMQRGSFVEPGTETDAYKYQETDNEKVNNMNKSLERIGANNDIKTREAAALGGRLARDLGLDIEFTNKQEIEQKIKNGELNPAEGTDVNGYVANGKMYLNIDSDKMVNFTVGHETKHFFEANEELNKSLNNALEKYARLKGRYEEDLARVTKTYTNKDGKLVGDPKAELMADYVGEFFTDYDFVSNLSTKNPTLFTKVRDFFQKLYYKATNQKEKLFIKQINDNINKVYREYAKTQPKQEGTKYLLSNAKTAKINEKQQNRINKALELKSQNETDEEIWKKTGVIFDNNEIKYHVEDFTSKIDDINYFKNNLNKEMKLSDVFEGKIFESYPQLKDYDFEMSNFENDAIKENLSQDEINEYKKIKASAYDNGIIANDIIKDIKELESVISHEAQHLIQQLNGEDVDSSKVYREQGKEAYRKLPTELEAEVNRVLNNMTSEQKKNINPQSIKDEILKYYKENNYNAIDVDKVINRLVNKHGIQYSLSNKDNQGRELTKEQQEYFKDSKVRDDKGRLLEVYHGSPNEFTVFDKNKTSDYNTLGQGFYFTSSKEIADSYQGGVLQNNSDKSHTKAVYLNIKNPYNLNENITDAEIKQFQKLAQNNMMVDSDGDSYQDTFWYKRMYEIDYNNFPNKWNKGVIPELVNRKDLIEFKNWLREHGETDYSDGNQLTRQDVYGIFTDNFYTIRSKKAIQEFIKTQNYDGYLFNRNGNGITNDFDNINSSNYVAFESNQIKNVDNTNPTDNPDIRYSLSEDNIQDKINQSMTMQEAKQMIERAFITSDMKEWTDGAISNVDEWVNSDEWSYQIPMIIENTYELQSKYINANPDIVENELYTIDDVIEAYKNGTLTGKQKTNVEFDLAKENNYKPTKFYEPQNIEGGKELYDIANQRVTNSNRREVYRARGNLIINAHNEGYVESLGISQEEFNKKLKSWSNYTQNAQKLSDSLNKNVSEQNRWTGIENSSIVNTLGISEQEMESLVKEVKGTSNEWEKRYITSTMLALDTHIDYKNLTFDFAPDRTKMDNKALADYSAKDDTIRVSQSGQNTIAHEMGHYIDHLWGREVFGNNLGITNRTTNFENLTQDQKDFVNNFYNFFDKIESTADIGSTYKMTPTEVFARFTARFVEWTKNVATNNRYGYEEKWYQDKFTPSQYQEFVKILQQKSYLDTISSEKYSLSQQGEDLEQQYQDLFPIKNKVTTRLSDLKRKVVETPTEEENALKTDENEQKQGEKPTRREVIDKNRQLAREQLGDITKIKDKKRGFLYQINTMKRNLRDIMSKEQAQKMYDTYFKNVTENNAKIENEINSYNERIQKYNLNDKESTYTQMVGELKYNPETTLTQESVDSFYNKNRNKIDQQKCENAALEFRSIYDELINKINDTLTDNGYKAIEYRKGYFPHFIEEKATSKLGKLAEKLGWKVQKGQLPTDIAGITDQFKPGKAWTSFSQQRTGDATDYNALKGLDNYLRGAMDIIYHTNDIQKLRALENEIRYQYSSKGIQEKIDNIYADDNLDMEEKNDAIANLTADMRGSGLGNFVTEIRNYTDNLANKKSFSDRSMEQAFGRDVYSIMNNINGRVSANMVGANISSAITNFIPITQAWGNMSTKNLLRGMYESIKTSIKGDNFADKSTFLTNRTKQADRLYNTKLQKINKALGVPFEAIDSFTANTIVRGKYYDNIAKGMSEQEAIQNADEFAKDVMAGRSKGDQPTMFNKKNPLVKLFTAFQLEVNNQYGYMFKDIPTDLADEAKDKLIGAFIKMFLGAWLYNEVTEKMTGRRAAFDPVDMAISDVKTLTDENMDLGDKIQSIVKDTSQELPFVSGVMGGGRLPIQGAIPYSDPLSMVTSTLEDIGKIDDPKKRKTAINNLKKEWSKPLYYVAMPFAGGQLKKTIEGLSMYDKDLPVAGSYTNSGKLRFEADTSTLGKIQSAVFGQYASKNAREYFEKGYTPLTEKQLNTALDADMSANEYREYNKGLKEQKTTEDKVDYIYDLPISNEQKNVLVNSALNRKDNIDLSDYGNYGSLEEFDYANKNPEKYLTISNITDYNTFQTYKNDLAEIKKDYNNTEDRKQAVFEYINSLPLSIEQKLMLQKMGAGYSVKQYKNQLRAYINSLDLSIEEKQSIDDVLFK